MSEFYFFLVFIFNDLLFGRHLIAQQYLGVLLAPSFMLLVAATGYVFSILHVLFTKKKPFYPKNLSRLFHFQYLSA